MDLFKADAQLERRLVSWWKSLSPWDQRAIGFVASVVILAFLLGQDTTPSPSYLQQEQNRNAACAEVLAKARATGKSDEKTGACLLLLMGHQ